MSATPIDDLWQEYRKMAFSGAPRERLVNVHRVFFSGAAAMFVALMNHMANEDHGEKEDEAFINGARDEIREMGKTLDQEAMAADAIHN